MAVIFQNQTLKLLEWYNSYFSTSNVFASFLFEIQSNGNSSAATITYCDDLFPNSSNKCNTFDKFIEKYKFHSSILRIKIQSVATGELRKEILNLDDSRSSHRRCSIKKWFLKIAQYPQLWGFSNTKKAG